MGKAEVTPWERFLALLESNDVPVYQVCSVLEMEEEELKKKIRYSNITLLDVLKIWKLLGVTSAKIVNLFFSGATIGGRLDEKEEDKQKEKTACKLD